MVTQARFASSPRSVRPNGAEPSLAPQRVDLTLDPKGFKIRPPSQSGAPTKDAGRPNLAPYKEEILCGVSLQFGLWH